ncbi:hypothetical protein K501DRAFT_307182 [Backusella circina FSU 941]|nr:hypothetical protein K501DRAFT_307182 [Backusella circina FSU 941]
MDREWEDDYGEDDTYPFDEEDDYDQEEERQHRPSRQNNSQRNHRNHRDSSYHREENRRAGASHHRHDGYEDGFGDYNFIDDDTGFEDPNPLVSESQSVAVTSASSSQPLEEDEEFTQEPLFELGDGLPALPPKMKSPLRQGEDTIIKAQEVETTTAEPEFSMPPGSDLGAVGKIGVYQMAQHHPSASSQQFNMVFWVYVLTLLVTFVLAKK